MQTVRTAALPTMPAIGGLHHLAYKCRNAEETRHFYEDVLGLPLAHVMVRRDLEATTGELVSFIHLFFQLADGSYIAFFDLGDGTAPAKDPKTPPFTTHVAVKIGGEEALQSAVARLEAMGVDFQGPIDQEGFVRSVYLWDPNGVRLELTYELPRGTLEAEHGATGREMVASWVKEHGARAPAV